MLALLGNTGVVDNPGADWCIFLDLRQHERAHGRKQLAFVPWCLRHEMMQRLVLGADLVGRNACRHRLDALSVTGQQQSGAVRGERSMPIHMTDHFAQMLDILSKTRRHTLRGPQIHRRPQNESGIGCLP